MTFRFFGADFSVESLVRKLENHDIIIPTFGHRGSDNGEISGFHRNHVWSKLEADRFIESLLLDLPVPGIFLASNQDRSFLVLDGQQRLRTLQKFCTYPGTGEKYRLHRVHPSFEGRSYSDLDPADCQRLDDRLIHATIVEQIAPTTDQSGIYDVFERLNAGGVNLQPQEIRDALYHGELARLLSELNEDTNWRHLYGRKSDRLKDLEMILRFFAFYYHGNNYAEPMKFFLNEYMSTNRDLKCQSKDELKKLFGDTTSFLKDYIGERAFRPEGRLNAAVLDSVMTGLAKRIQRGPIENTSEVKNRLLDLFESGEYLSAVADCTAKESKVEIRQRLALEAFADIQ